MFRFLAKLAYHVLERTAYVLARLCGSVGLPEPLLFECAITAPFLWHGSYFNTWTGKVELQWLKHLWDHGNLFRNMGSSSHWGFIIAPGQEANGDNSRIPKYFDLLYKMLCCVHLLESPRWGDSYSIQNIQFHDKIRKVPQKSLYIYIYLLSWAIGRISYGLKNEFESAKLNEPSVFSVLEILRFDCIWAKVVCYCKN